MSSSLLEYIRTLHNEICTDKKSISKDLLNPQEKHKKKIFQSHGIKAKLKRIRNNNKTLLKLYEDKSGLLREMEKSISGKNNLGVFYSKLNELLSNKKQIIEQDKQTEKGADFIETTLNFSGEEYYGKYVEMNSLYELFLNVRGMPSMYLNGLKKIDYKLYLEVFDHFHNIDQEAKQSKQYQVYSRKVVDYLFNFYCKRHPMHPADEMIKEIKNDFDKKWEAKSVAGWQKEWPKDVFQRYPAKSSVSVEEKKKKFEESQKKDKKDKNWAFKYCEKCEKTIKETVWSFHLNGKRHKKNIKKKEKLNSIKKTKKFQFDLDEVNESKQTAYFEFVIKIFKTLLADVFEETCYYIEKKLTRSYAETKKELEEREKEDNEERENAAFGEGEDQSLWNGGVYNPKKIPLGWDGRPIPYWLYKFHGLNIGYLCEICGGTKYYGPRAFQQHFKEWKHAHGMRALGLPNTKHFHNITKVEEAEALYQKLKEKKILEIFNPNLEEEFEDNEGNVYGRQTYEALKRQRVI